MKHGSSWGPIPKDTLSDFADRCEEQIKLGFMEMNLAKDTERAEKMETTVEFNKQKDAPWKGTVYFFGGGYVQREGKNLRELVDWACDLVEPKDE